MAYCCYSRTRAVTGLASQRVNSLDALPDFVAQVEALPEGAIPAACRADLLTATPTPGWSGPGFLNMDWRGMVAQPTPTPGVTGAPDETLSGDRRYYRTNEIIATLVATHEW